MSNVDDMAWLFSSEVGQQQATPSMEMGFHPHGRLLGDETLVNCVCNEPPGSYCVCPPSASVFGYSPGDLEQLPMQRIHGDSNDFVFTVTAPHDQKDTKPPVSTRKERRRQQNRAAQYRHREKRNRFLRETLRSIEALNEELRQTRAQRDYFRLMYEGLETQMLEIKISTTHLTQVYWSDVQAADHNSLIVPLALQNPALFNAMMAKALTDFRFGGNGLSDDMVPRCNDNESRSVKIDFAFFKVQALKHLRLTLGDGAMREIFQSIVITTIFLVKIELVEGHVKEVRMHLRALRELFQNGASLEFLSPCARLPSLLTINLACSVCQEPPILVPASCANTVMSDEFMKAMNDCPITI
ncbi:uncharacterized protein Z519_12384 [Cladophialophora bantiana CBS 173.52]|uniref:BZIP domain-containing protein n=1 Tax=Cladophialophora bantiana (strain ATCC 10958 / CBS 173.52 / CDC B-1940 / NIH 8579) TaxID=1442370 RepID=A0A0D2FK69_CLAB1|nr:uncharacterized protein Z519_12384 [Cladophialophora bantiana CBS 173.52]KIW87087.1 hypothetical protein Z519_12384 [Cladophialophora bantiana CBS 173.52]